MTGPEHYAEAGRLVEKAASAAGGLVHPDYAKDTEQFSALAQVHATLALAAATAALIPEDDGGNLPVIQAWTSAGAW